MEVPINWRSSVDTIHYILKDSEAKALLINADFVDQLRSILEDLEDLIVFVFGIQDSPTVGESYEKVLLSSENKEPDEEGPSDDDLVYIIYTGGTTGRPKGVMFHEKMQLEEGKGHIYTLNLDANDVALNIMPWFHSGGHALSSAVAYAGGDQCDSSKIRSEKTLELIEKEKVTVVQMVPTMIAMLLEDPEIDRYNLQSLRTIMYVGAPMPESLLKKAMERFGKNRFLQSYGLTEFGPLATRLSPQDHVLAIAPEASEKERSRLKSVGLPVYYVWLRILDGEGNPLPKGQAGEIALRGETMTKGYWKKPELTQQKIKNGWLLTGDIGYVDEDGYLYLLDRKDDMIITGGENVYPSRVEEILCSHPAVKEAAVVGLPDEKWGEKVVAALSLWPNASVTEEELIEYCKGRLAGYERPKAVFIFPELPKSSAGKILRREVRENLKKMQS